MQTVFTDIIDERVLKEIAQKTWYRYGVYRDNIFFAAAVGEGLGKEFFKSEWIERSFENVLRLNDEAYVLWDEFEHMSACMRKMAEHDALYLTRYKEAHILDNSKVIQVSKEIQSHDFGSLSAEQLATHLSEFYNVSRALFHWLWSMAFLNNALDVHVKSVIAKWQPTWSEEKVSGFITSVSYLSEKFPFEIEREKILVLDAQKISEESPQIAELHQEYAWLALNTWDGRPFSRIEYYARVKGFLKDREELMSIIDENNKKVQEAERIIARVDDKKVQTLLHHMQELIYLKTASIDVFSKSWFNILGLVDEVAHRLGVSYDDFLKLTFEEVIFFLKTGKPISPDELKERERYVVLRLNGVQHCFYGGAYERIRAILYRDNCSSLSEVHGTVAYPGVVRGVAKVLLTDRELDKVDRGDILVANLTNPNYDPVFSKIAGMVTDEGGLLCHSAIMAREFKIPCVIATKIATRVFKDGDRVEVDAETGVVRKC